MRRNDLQTEQAKDKIIKAAIELLNEGYDAGKITVRQIAERANVGTGLINYHFQTKENLLHKAVGSLMESMAVELGSINEHPGESPAGKLKTMLKNLSDTAMQYRQLNQISVSYELMHGNFQVPLFLIPLLREISGPSKSETELRMIAFHIIIPLQLIFLRPAEFQMYSGIHIFDKVQRDAYIDMLVDQITK